MIIPARVVEETNIIEPDVEPVSVFFDFLSFSKENGNPATASSDLAGGLNDAWIAAFREDNPLRMASQFLQQ